MTDEEIRRADARRKAYIQNHPEEKFTLAQNLGVSIVVSKRFVSSTSLQSVEFAKSVPLAPIIFENETGGRAVKHV